MVFSFFLFLAAFGTSFFLTPLARNVALRFGIMDQPETRKLHRNPVPLLGGLAIYFSVVVAILLFFEVIQSSSPQAWYQILGILGGASLLVMVGALDDRGRLHPQIKLVMGMPLAAALLFWGGVRATAWPGVTAFDSQTDTFFVVSLALTLLWVLTITASFSILDHMDGLCSGVAAIASGFFWILAAQHGQILVGSFAAAMLGATLGFLRWNFNPAQIFMGDSGALFIGFMMATLGIKMEFQDVPTTQSWMIPVLILGVPIFDTGLVTISRIRRRLIPFSSPGQDHTAHRLANLGLGQRGAVILLHVIAAILGCAAMVVSELSLGQSYLLLALLGFAGLVAIIALERSGHDTT
ncbi:MAG: MraY family glycosyltransferase [Acidobacteriota bacterium]